MADPLPDIGDDVILHAEFRTKVNGVDTLTDPTGNTCTMTVHEPDGTAVVVGNVARVSQGIYEGTFTPTLEGEHWWKAVGLGAAKGAEQTYFTVRKQRVP